MATILQFYKCTLNEKDEYFPSKFLVWKKVDLGDCKDVDFDIDEIYRVVKRIFQVAYLLNTSFNFEAGITKLHVGILLSLLDNMMFKNAFPA